MAIHGTQDRVVALRNARATVSLWAEAAGAQAGEPAREQRGRRHAMTITEHRRRGRTVARLVEVDALGHAWSGGAARQPFSDARGPDASRMVWRFVRRQWDG
jgi:poly(3-hydroxybutyrate) depolymerase